MKNNRVLDRKPETWNILLNIKLKENAGAYYLQESDHRMHCNSGLEISTPEKMTQKKTHGKTAANML